MIATTPKGWKVEVTINDQDYKGQIMYGYNHVHFGGRLVSGWSNEPDARCNATQAEALVEADKVIEAFRAEIEQQTHAQITLLEVV